MSGTGGALVAFYGGLGGALLGACLVLTAACVAWLYRDEIAEFLDRPPVDLDAEERAARAYHPSARQVGVPVSLPVNGRAVCDSCTITHPERHLDIRPLVSPVGGLLEAWVCPTCGYDNVYRAPVTPVRGDVR